MGFFDMIPGYSMCLINVVRQLRWLILAQNKVWSMDIDFEILILRHESKKRVIKKIIKISYHKIEIK